MKNVIFTTAITLLFNTHLIAQQLQLNDMGNYHYQEVVEAQAAEQYTTGLQDAGLKAIETDGNNTTATGTMSVKSKGVLIQVHYQLRIEEKDNRYRLTIHNLEFENYAGYRQAFDTAPEKYQRKWLGQLNEGLVGEVEKIKEGMQYTDSW